MLGLGVYFYHGPAWPQHMFSLALGAAFAVTPGNEGPPLCPCLALGWRAIAPHTLSLCTRKPSSPGLGIPTARV